MNLSMREGPNDGHAPGSEADKERLCAWIDAHRHEMVAFLQELIRIPADNPPGDCQRIADWLYRHLQAFPLDDVQLLPVPQERVESVGMVRVANVVARMVFGDGSGPVVGLNAHGDAVAPGLGWTRNPYGGDVVEGAVYGRGAAVSKSDIAVYTYAAAALRIVTAPLSGRVDLVFTFDEESGGTIGPARLLAEGTIRPDVAITAGFTHSIVNAHGGCLHLEVRLQGRSAHAAEPELGVDALEAMTQVLHELYQYRDRLAERRSKIPGLGSPTLVVGLIRGGINTNVVPDECVIRLDRRLIPEEDGDQVENEIRRLIEEAVSSRPVRVDIQRILYAKPLRPTPPESRIVQTLKQNWTTVMGGREPDIHGVPLYTDARHFAEAGIPVVLFGAGPRTLAEAGGHRADEHVRIDDMVLAAKILTMTLYDLLRKGVGGNER
ncbi:MAG: ArgE/DapE family deacylase [Kyrpidia tusciae]|nr:ArgE/DapE family deacylase [Kyrpidia tusciae]MBE3552201.1 ArgE/DapE family deacylase [Kyrpidia tusciae]